ncbi:MAG: TIR domain-containing protein, partial [Opitutaceae bacterium]
MSRASGFQLSRSYPTVPDPAPTNGPAVFLSYAREDGASVQRIADALRAFGVEVWFDQNELRGGDTWDQKIRSQIRSCALFVPIVSAQTEARSEGYFRREWRLAVDRTHDMAANRAFIVPVVIDDTRESGAAVPEEFMRYQWTRLVQGVPTAEFIAQIRRLLEAPAKPPAPAARAATVPAPTVSTRRRPGSLLVIGAVAAAVIAAGVYFALRRDSTGRTVTATPPATAVAGSDKSVAVLAFTDLSEKRDSAYFSDGISEELLNVLAKVPGLRVAARTSAFFFKDKNLPVPEIAQKLNVAYVVEGSVQRAGERVKITAQLIKAADGFHLWSDTFTRDFKDVFAVQEEIARLIAGKLQLQLGVSAPAASAAAASSAKINPEAYDAYLRGRAAQTAGYSERTRLDTMRLYEAALRIDPDYALAWARLAEFCARTYNSGFDRGDDLVSKARSAAAAALRLAPDLPEARLAQARILQNFENDSAGAARELDAVERLRPGDVEVPAVRALIGYSTGASGDALVTLARRAVDADPQNADTLLAAANYLLIIGHFAEAERWCDRALAAGEPGDESIRLKHLNLYAWTGDAKAALAVLDTMPVAIRAGNVRFFNSRGLYLSRTGDPAGALAEYEAARRLVERELSDRIGPRGTALQALYSMSRIEGLSGRAARESQLLDQVVVEAEKFRKDFPSGSQWALPLGLALAKKGRRDEAVAALDAGLQRSLVSRNVPAVR